MPEDYDIVPDDMFSPTDEAEDALPTLSSVWSTDQTVPEFGDMVQGNEDLILE